MFIEIEPYFEPIEIFNKIGERKTELEDDSLGFICGMIRKYKPKKIVEVGVSAGGTTCVILDCLEKLNIDAKVYSVDLAYTYHYDETKACGFQVEDAKPYLNSIHNHKLLLGKTIGERIDEIMNDGEKIDLLILDTIHYLPGELLDFIVCMPFMSERSCVICDDLLFAHGGENTQAIATKVLYDTIVADKCFLQNSTYENLMGFQLNEHSWMYKNDYFSALITPWSFYPSEEMLTVYRNIIAQYYTDEAMQIFDYAVSMNKKTVNNQDSRRKEIRSIFELCDKSTKTVIYGAGKRGTALNYFLTAHGHEVEGYVVSDNIDKNEFKHLNNKVFHLSEIVGKDYNILIAVADGEVRRNLENRGVIAYDVPNFIFPFIKDYQKLVEK